MDMMDLFKPYSPEIRGDLVEYLRDREENLTANHFFGPEYFFAIKEKGFMIPGVTWVRVNRSPAPDLGYIVNDAFELESQGPGEYNMSLIGAEKGVYDPVKVLSNRSWSVSNLHLPERPAG